MAEELKHLIEQIQKEGVDKAKEQADAIISQAKDKAAKLVAEAETKAADLLKKAESESKLFADRSVKTLEQAARDTLITVGQGCEKVVTAVLGKEVDQTLSGTFLQTLISNVVEQGKAGSSITIATSEKDKATLAAYCATLAKKSGKEIELVSDNETLSGFKVSYKGQNVYLDFSGEAISTTLCAFLRPELAKTVSAIARQQVAKS